MVAALLACTAAPCEEGTALRAGVTLLTQCTRNRLWHVTEICNRWRGPMALGLFVTSDSAAAKGEGQAAAAKCKGVGVATKLGKKSDRYPVNVLRNLAWSLVRTRHVFVLDVDFWPSVGSLRDIESALAAPEVARSENPVAMVVPAFSLFVRGQRRSRDALERAEHAFLRRNVPMSRQGLLRCVANGEASSESSERWERWEPAPSNRWEGTSGNRRLGAAERGTPRVFKQKKVVRTVSARTSNPKEGAVYCSDFHHHGSTRLVEWFGASRPSRLPCFLGDFYEPYVVLETCGNAPPPRFDERFDGYGKNKLEWIAALRGAGYAFYTAPRAFTVHTPHPQSHAQVTWGDRMHSQHKNTMNGFYARNIIKLGLLSSRSDTVKRHHRDTQCADFREHLIPTPLCAASKTEIRAIETSTKRAARYAWAARGCLESLSTGRETRCAASDPAIARIDARQEAMPWPAKLTKLGVACAALPPAAAAAPKAGDGGDPYA